MSEISYHDSVTVETEVKPNDDIYYLNITNFKFFGLSEKAIQTDLTLKDIMKIDFNNKQFKENKMKQEPLKPPFNTNNKKETLSKSGESIRNENSENKLTEVLDDNNNEDYNSNLSKSTKKNKKEEKKEIKKDRDNLLEKKRKRDDEDKQSPFKNKTKVKEVNKIKEKDKDNKDKEKEKPKNKTLKEKAGKIKHKEDKLESGEKSRNSAEKKEKQEK